SVTTSWTRSRWAGTRRSPIRSCFATSAAEPRLPRSSAGRMARAGRPRAVSSPALAGESGLASVNSRLPCGGVVVLPRQAASSCRGDHACVASRFASLSPIPAPLRGPRRPRRADLRAWLVRARPQVPLPRLELVPGARAGVRLGGAGPGQPPGLARVRADVRRGVAAVPPQRALLDHRPRAPETATAGPLLVR